MRTSVKIAAVTAMALALVTGTAAADDPVTQPVPPTEKWFPIIGCLKK